MKRMLFSLVLFSVASALAADTVSGHSDYEGQTQKVAVVEGPVILRSAANEAVLNAYKGAAGEVMWTAETPYDLHLHVGDGKTGGWSVFRDYVLPLWENRWISWGANVADATGELRMHGHPVALSAAWGMRATDILAISYGTNVVAYFGNGTGSGGGSILDYSVDGDVHTVTCVYVDGDTAAPRLQTTTALPDAVWADAADVVTNRLDASTVALVHTNSDSNAFYRVVWTDGFADGLTVFGNVTADSFTLGGVRISAWPQGDVTAAMLEAATNALATELSGELNLRVPWVADVNSNYTAVTIGTRSNDSIIGIRSFTQGLGNTASGANSHAVGYNTTASGDYSLAQGGRTTATGLYSHAEGVFTTASGNYSHAEGNRTIASGNTAHADGQYATASHANSYAWSGIYNGANNYGSKGNGTFNINPANGAGGFFIGETNLHDHVLNISAEAWATETWTFTTTNGETVSKRVILYGGAE